MGRVLAAAIVLALALPAAPAHADMGACESAARRDDPDDLIRLYTLCLDGLRPDLRAGAHHNRGVAYLRKGDMDAALQDFNDSLRYDEDYALPYAMRASIHGQRGEFDLALADLDRAIGLPPARIRTDLYYQRGNVRAVLGDFAGALADFDEVIDRDDDRMDAMAAKAMLLASAPDPAVRDPETAVALFQDIVAEEDSGPARLGMAVAYAELGRFDDAVREHMQGMDMMRAIGVTDPMMDEALARYQAAQAGAAVTP